MRPGDLVFVIPDRYWEKESPYPAKVTRAPDSLGLMMEVKPTDGEPVSVPTERVFWMLAMAEQTMTLLKRMCQLRDQDNKWHGMSKEVAPEIADKPMVYADDPKHCETCRYCDTWHKKRRSCFPWIPDNHACYHRRPQECGPGASWQHWRTRNLKPGEDYWTGKIDEKAVAKSSTD